MMLTNKVFMRIFTALSFLFLLITSGTLGYMYIEQMNFMDALYMTVITVSTVGFEEVKPLSVGGRFFTMVLVLTGVGVLFYSLGTAIEYFFGDFLELGLAERRKKTLINNLKEHYLICGYGRVGEEVASELKKMDVDFVIIDDDEDRLESADKEGFLTLKGDATDETILKEAKINLTKGIVASAGNDAVNVFIVLTARSLEPEIFIVARANTLEAEEKLFRAGANRVISPSVIGGRRMASLLVRPRVSEYIDALSFGEDLQFQLEQYKVDDNSPIAGTTLEESAVRDKTGAVIVLVQYPDGLVDNVPRAKTKIVDGSKVIIMGTQQQLDLFEELYIVKS